MADDDLTRAIPAQDEQTVTKSDPSETVVRPEVQVGETPSGVRVLPGGPDPSDTVVRPLSLPASEEPTDDEAAPTVEHFQLQGELGRGGMGVVYSALDTRFMRDVAVKVLSERMAGNPTAERRFLEEARVTSQLTHTVIPPVHHIGALPDGRPFLVMKLIKGNTLAERLKARPDPSAELTDHLSTVEQVCLGVGYAHSRGVIHRDLKPGNIMVGAFGEVLVMDWGLAKQVRAGHRHKTDPDFTASDDPAPAADEAAPPDTVLREVRPADVEPTRAGTILGTPAYMSPEQASGDMEAVGPRSDVFSLGAILCVVLTGQPPYTGKKGQEVVLKAMDWDITDAFRRLGHCKADPLVVELCKRCLAKDPTQRPANGEAVATELAHIRATSAERLREADLKQAARIAKGQELKRRRRWQIGLGAAAAAACTLAVFGAPGWFLWSQERDARVNTETRLGKSSAEVTSLQGRLLGAETAEAKAHADFDEYKQSVTKQGEQAAARHREQEFAQSKADLSMREASGRGSLGQVRIALADVRKARDVAAWDEALNRARSSQREAEAGLKEGTGLTEVPKSDFASEVRASAAQVERAEKERRLVTEVEEVASAVLDRERIGDRHPAVAGRYKRAFDTAGWALTAPGEFALRMKEHPTPSALIAAVFDWHQHADADDRKALAALLDKITADNLFFSRWWTAVKDTRPVGTKVLLDLASGPEAVTLLPPVLDQLFWDLWNRGERDAACRLIRAGVLRHPSSYRLHARFALHLEAMNTPAARTEAIAHATAALALRAESVNALLLLARLTAEQSGDPADALPYLDRALTRFADSLPVRLARAEVYTRLKQSEQAEREIAAVNRLDPTGAGRLEPVRGRWANGERDTAVAELKGRLLSTIPKTPDAQFNLARTCRGMLLDTEAEAAYRTAISLTPAKKSFDLRTELARYLQDQAEGQLPTERTAKLRAAAKVWTEAATEFDADYRSQWYLVFVYAKLKDGPNALAAGKRAATLGQGIADTEWVLGLAHLTAGEYAEAATVANRLTKWHSDDARGFQLLGRIAAARGQWAEAVGHATRAAKLRSGDPALWSELGTYHAYRLESANAVKALAKAIDLRPTDSAAHFHISWHHLRQGDTAKWLEHLSRAGRLALTARPPALPLLK